MVCRVCRLRRASRPMVGLADVRFDVALFAVVIGRARNGPRMNGDQQQASGTALLAIVNRRAVLGAGARPSRVTAWPFVKSARLLSAEGHPADAVIEMWRPNTDASGQFS